MQEKVAVFENHDVIVDLHLLNDHLKSPESSINVDSVKEFIEAMAIVGFNRLPVKRSGEKIFLRFRHSAFKSDEVPSTELYKRESTSSTEVKSRGSCKPIPISSNQLIESLLRKSWKEMRMTNVEFSRLLTHFHLESRRKTLSGENEINITVCDVEPPEYVDDEKIAGFYGNISTEQLKKAMGKYLPVFGEAEITDLDLIEEIIEVEVDETEEPKRKKSKKKNSDNDSMSITSTPKRKYKKRARKILPRETQQATDFLLMKNAEFETENAQILECFAELNVGN